MRTARSRWLASAAALGLGVAMACSSSDGGMGPGAASVVGNYTLVSFIYGIPTTATGTLVFTAGTFDANIHVTAPSDTTIALAGSYSTKHTGVGDSIYLSPPALPQIGGSYLFNNAKDTLALNLSFGGTALQTVWHKN